MRYTFEIGDVGYQALEELREATCSPTKTEVMRDALALYAALIEKAQAGHTIFVGRDRTSAVPLTMVSLERAARGAKPPAV